MLWLWSPEPSEPPRTASVPPSAPPDIPRQTQAAQPEPVASTPAPEVAASVIATPSEPPALATSTPDEEQTVPPLAPLTPAEHGTRPRLAIIIDDCGQWPVTERGFVALPFPVTLSVLPHVRYGSEIARVADAAGKGVMLHLPMQTISGQYPGPGTITIAMNDAAIRHEVEGDLADLPQARGVNNHEGSLATQNTRVMGDVIGVLARDGRFFIDSRTSAASVGQSVAQARGVPSASRSVFLDNVDNETAVEVKLREAAADARANGSAIAIGHPRPATLAAVKALGPEFLAAGVELTLASDLVH